MFKPRCQLFCLPPTTHMLLKGQLVHKRISSRLLLEFSHLHSSCNQRGYFRQKTCVDGLSFVLAGLPDDKAWGKKRKQFYGADVDADIGKFCEGFSCVFSNMRRFHAKWHSQICKQSQMSRILTVCDRCGI